MDTNLEEDALRQVTQVSTGQGVSDGNGRCMGTNLEEDALRQAIQVSTGQGVKG